MKILALPNAFKGSLSAQKAGQVFVRALAKRHTVRVYPLSDGGDGFLDFFKALDPHAKTIFTNAKNAFLKTRRAPFLLLSDGKTAVVETAKICGLGTARPGELDPMGASSYGVGQVLAAAVKRGATTLYVGLGGVACNDGGAGLAAACGARLLDKYAREIPPGAKGLQRLAQIDLTPLQKRFKNIKIIAVTDVTNPLLGPMGSARVFGPQKGASARQVLLLERALTRWANVLKQTTGADVRRLPGAGAAGAMAAGLYGCLRTQLTLGTDFLFQKARLDKQIRQADLIITTEGKLDAQTFYGKAPGAVLRLAHHYQKPVLFICGQLDPQALRRAAWRPDVLAVLTDFAADTDDSKKYAALYLRRICQAL